MSTPAANTPTHKQPRCSTQAKAVMFVGVAVVVAVAVIVPVLVSRQDSAPGSTAHMPAPPPPPSSPAPSSPAPSSPAWRAKFEGDQNIFGFMEPWNDPLCPEWDAARGGRVPNSQDTREQIEINETFTVAPGEERDFDNVIIWVRPTAKADIEVSGTLRVRNSLLLWDQTSHQQTRLRI